MVEGKIKSVRSTKSSRQTKTKSKLVRAAKKRRQTKTAPSVKTATAKRGTSKTKKSTVPNQISNKPAVRFVPTRTLAPLPKPLEITPTFGYSASQRDRLRNQLTTAPHRWSLRHNIFTIAVLTVVGCLALMLVASYAQLTFSYIDTYSTNQTSILKPVSLTKQTFALETVTVTLAYPATYAVSATTSDTIEWQYTAEPTTTAQLRVHKNESDNIFTWLQNNQPDYSNAELVTPSLAVAAMNGVVVKAQDADGLTVYVVYWPYQKNLAEKYSIELMLTADPSSELAKRLPSDLELFISAIQID